MSEQRARDVLRGILGGTVVARDVPGAPARTHDFDLTVSGGRTIAVEVTTSTDRRIVEFWRAVHEHFWEAPQLSNSWVLNITPPAHVKTLRGKTEPLLRQVEDDGIRGFGLGHTAKSPEIEQSHRLGVKRGDVLIAHPSHIYIISTGAGAVGIDAVREAIDQEAMKPDNRNKLQRAAGERHLFVWVDPLNTQTAAAMGFMDIALPTGCTLPPEIDVVWVAIPLVDDSGKITGERMWRNDRSAGWQKVE